MSTHNIVLYKEVAYIVGTHLNCIDFSMQIQMSTHNMCLYKEVDKKYTGCNLKTTELLDYRVHTCQGNAREIKKNFKVREFCDVSGKNEILQKCKGIIHFWSRCIFFAKFVKFLAPVISGKFEFVSGKCQGIVREFWSVLNVRT